MVAARTPHSQNATAVVSSIRGCSPKPWAHSPKSGMSRNNHRHHEDADLISSDWISSTCIDTCKNPATHPLDSGATRRRLCSVGTRTLTLTWLLLGVGVVSHWQDKMREVKTSKQIHSDHCRWSQPSRQSIYVRRGACKATATTRVLFWRLGLGLGLGAQHFVI